MWIIYIFYVLIVVIGEAYKKWAKQQRRKKRELKRQKREEERQQQEYEYDQTGTTTVIDRIMPKMKVFSNESMRDLLSGAESPHTPENQATTPNAEADTLSTNSTASAIAKASMHSGDKSTVAANQYQSMNDTPMTAPGSSLDPAVSNNRNDPAFDNRFKRENLSTADITHGSHQLYHRLQEEDERARKESLQRARQDSLASTVASSDAGSIPSSSDESDSMSNRPPIVRWLFFIAGLPTIIVTYACIITVPMTDKNWDDRIAPITCLTAPVFALYSFGLIGVGIDLGSFTFPLWALFLILSIIPTVITVLLIRRKHEMYKLKKRETKDTLIDATASSVNAGDSGINTKDDGNGNGNSLPSLAEDTADIFQLNNNNENVHKKKEVPIENQCVFKIYFLFLGFIAAVGWIEIVANELVNLLTTMGVYTTINLDILGLTVLAWGNSIGDMIADVSVSRRGYSKMGIGAAIGGPTLNVLIGVGLGFAIKTIGSSSGEVTVDSNSNVMLSCCGVLVGMLVYAIVVPLSGWKLTKFFGYWCFFYYGLFLTVNVLAFMNVFD